jgi:Carbohydrate family 9 binding domain-like
MTRWLPKIFSMMLALIVTLMAYGSTALKAQRGVWAREMDVGAKACVLRERTPMSLRKDGVIFLSSQEMNFEQRKEREPEDEVEASFTNGDVAVADLDNAAWETARPVSIKRYWSGEDAPAGRQAEARLLWSDKALHVRFVYQQTEPPVVSSRPQTRRKTIGLWERDVCEIFITPNVNNPERYFEFEAAATGEWLDLKVHQKPDERETDWKFNSGMTTAHRITPEKVTIAMRVPWKALGRKPQAGERWRGNLFRVTGSGTTRGYVTWRPTHTPEPNFHVPAAFGWIRFKR